MTGVVATPVGPRITTSSLESLRVTLIPSLQHFQSIVNKQTHIVKANNMQDRFVY